MIWYTPTPGARLHRHDPPAEQRALRPVHARPAPPGRRVDGGSGHPPHGAHLPHRQLQGAAPVHLVYRRHSAGADALPQLLRLPAAVGPAGVLGRDHRHLHGRSRAAARSSAKPSTCWPAARPTSAPTACCASTCCMCSSCRWCSSSSSLCTTTRSCTSASACPSDEEEVGQDTANKVPADRRVYFLPDVLIDETVRARSSSRP